MKRFQLFIPIFDPTFDQKIDTRPDKIARESLKIIHWSFDTFEELQERLRKRYKTNLKQEFDEVQHVRILVDGTGFDAWLSNIIENDHDDYMKYLM